MTYSAFIAGLGLGASLIIAIGAQNAFVLRQGLLRSHALAVAALCVAIDWSLIIVGALGFGALVGRFPALTDIAAWGGAAFLLAYGALAFRSAYRPDVLHVETSRARATRPRSRLRLRRPSRYRCSTRMSTSIRWCCSAE